MPSELLLLAGISAIPALAVSPSVRVMPDKLPSSVLVEVSTDSASSLESPWANLSLPLSLETVSISPRMADNCALTLLHNFLKASVLGTLALGLVETDFWEAIWESAIAAASSGFPAVVSKPSTAVLAAVLAD